MFGVFSACEQNRSILQPHCFSSIFQNRARSHFSQSMWKTLWHMLRTLQTCIRNFVSCEFLYRRVFLVLLLCLDLVGVCAKACMSSDARGPHETCFRQELPISVPQLWQTPGISALAYRHHIYLIPRPFFGAYTYIWRLRTNTFMSMRFISLSCDCFRQSLHGRNLPR